MRIGERTNCSLSCPGGLVLSPDGALDRRSFGRDRSWSPAAREMAEVLASGDRSRAGRMAPAFGLILWQVDYEAQGNPL